MVLAAGLGTRLRPLTSDRPKALVEVAGRTLLEITLARLRTCGISEVIVNVHHFADMIVDYLAANKNFGMRIELSCEEELLDTGGGLKKAAWFFLERTRDNASAPDDYRRDHGRTEPRDLNSRHNGGHNHQAQRTKQPVDEEMAHGFRL